MSAPPELVTRIQALVVEALQLDLDPGALGEDVSLFEHPDLDLDSVDALELVVALQNAFGIRVDDPSLGRRFLRTVGTMSDFVVEQGGWPRPG